MAFNPSTAQLVSQPEQQQSQDSSSGFDASTAQLVNQPPQQSSGDLSSLPNISDSDSTTDTDASLSTQPPVKFSFSDQMRMAGLNDQASQQKFLESKFKFAEPITDPNTGKPTGQFNVGNDPNNLQPLHPGGIGDQAISALASVASMAPSVLGQITGATIGAAAGTLAEGGVPGPGTIAGGIAGAGIGAGIGEAAKNEMLQKTPGYDPQKAAVDNIVTGAFGTLGQGLGEAINIGASKFIAPKIGNAIDASLSKNPGGAVALSKIFKFVANVDPRDTMKAAKIGFGKLAKNPEAWNDAGINDIAQDVSQAYAQKEGIAKAALDKSEDSLLNSNPDAKVSTSNILEQMTDQLGENGLQILNKTDSSLDGMGSTFQFRDDNPTNIPTSDVTKFMTRLGAMTTDGGRTFHIPEDASVNLSQAIGAKRLFQKAFNNPLFNKDIANVAKQALYGEGPSPLYPKGFVGLRSSINDVAKATGNDAYVVANDNFSKLMDSSKGVLKGNNGQKFNAPNWMDINDPSSVAKYLKNSNKLDSFGQQALDNLHNTLGGNFQDRAEQWATVSGLKKAQPQMLRLSVIAGLISLGIPGGNLVDKGGRVALAMQLANPKALMHVGQVGEIAGSVGKNVIGGLLKSANNKNGAAVISQLARKATGN